MEESQEAYEQTDDEQSGALPGHLHKLAGDVNQHILHERYAGWDGTEPFRVHGLMTFLTDSKASLAEMPGWVKRPYEILPQVSHGEYAGHLIMLLDLLALLYQDLQDIQALQPKLGDQAIPALSGDNNADLAKLQEWAETVCVRKDNSSLYPSFLEHGTVGQRLETAEEYHARLQSLLQVITELNVEEQITRLQDSFGRNSEAHIRLTYAGEQYLSEASAIVKYSLSLEETNTYRAQRQQLLGMLCYDSDGVTDCVKRILAFSVRIDTVRPVIYRLGGAPEIRFNRFQQDHSATGETVEQNCHIRALAKAGDRIATRVWAPNHWREGAEQAALDEYVQALGLSDSSNSLREPSGDARAVIQRLSSEGNHEPLLPLPYAHHEISATPVRDGFLHMAILLTSPITVPLIALAAIIGALPYALYRMMQTLPVLFFGLGEESETHRTAREGLPTLARWDWLSSDGNVSREANAILEVAIERLENRSGFSHWRDSYSDNLPLDIVRVRNDIGRLSEITGTSRITTGDDFPNMCQLASRHLAGSECPLPFADYRASTTPRLVALAYLFVLCSTPLTVPLAALAFCGFMVGYVPYRFARALYLIASPLSKLLETYGNERLGSPADRHANNLPSSRWSKLIGCVMGLGKALTCISGIVLATTVILIATLPLPLIYISAFLLALAGNFVCQLLLYSNMAESHAALLTTGKVGPILTALGIGALATVAMTTIALLPTLIIPVLFIALSHVLVASLSAFALPAATISLAATITASVATVVAGVVLLSYAYSNLLDLRDWSVKKIYNIRDAALFPKGGDGGDGESLVLSVVDHGLPSDSDAALMPVAGDEPAAEDGATLGALNTGDIPPQGFV